MKEMKRILSMVLALVLLVGLLPANVFAAGTSDGTDQLVFATDRHANTTVIGNVLTMIEGVIGDGEIDYVGLGGDMVNDTDDYDSSTVLTEVTNVASNLDATSVDITYGSHDENCNDDKGIFLSLDEGSGFLYETQYAYVYGVVHTDMSETANAQTAASAFKTWANGVADKSKVIIVLSHLPIHAQRNDNLGATYWHDALNSVADSDSDGTVDRDVLFFHGHNHTTESNKEYFIAVKGGINVAGGSTGATNYYTYTTAGYLNANKTATLVTITDSAITLNKYDADNSTPTQLTSFARVASSDSGDSGDSGDTDTDSGDDSTDEVEVGTTQTTHGKGTYTTANDGSFQNVTFGTEGEQKTVYVLVSTPTAGKNYIIASGNSAGTVYALKENTTTGTSVTVNAATDSITAPYIENSDNAIVWTASSGMNFKSVKGGYYLNYTSSSSGSGKPQPGGSSSSSYSLSFNTSSASDWTAGTNTLYRNGEQNDYYLRCNNGTWAMGSSNNTYNVYFYEEQTIDTSSSVTYEVTAEDIEHFYTYNTTTDAEGNTTSTIDLTKTATITASVTDGAPTGTYAYEVVGGDSIITSIDKDGVITFNGTEGTAQVKVSYTWTEDDVTYEIWDVIDVTATGPYYSIQLHKVELEKATDVTADNFSEGTYYYKDETTGFYHIATEYVEGTTYYTNEYTQGAEITNTVVLKGVKKDDVFAVWAVVKEHNAENPDGVDMGELGDDLTWYVSDKSIATIDPKTGVITFTGNNYGTFTVTVSYTGKDGKVIVDTIEISCTDSLYVVPGDGTDDFPDYPNEGAVRFDKTATGVGAFSQTGIAKVEISMTGVPMDAPMDVVVVIDWTGSMNNTTTGSEDRYDAAVAAAKAFVETIMEATDGTLNDVRLCLMAFKGSTVGQVKLTATTTSSTTTFVWEQITADYLNQNYPLDADVDGDGDMDLADQLTELVTAKLTTTTFDTATNGGSNGTYYSTALEKAYNLLTGTTYKEGEERSQFCVFMSDGAPTGYYYTVTRTYDSEGKITNWAKSTDALESSDIIEWVDPQNAATSETAVTTSVQEEYFSTVMKEKYGITIFTVGLGLTSGSDGVTGYEDLGDYSYQALGEAILTSIASTPTENSAIASYFTSVADTSGTAGMETTFKKIATSILDAATDVVVEDKIGAGYTVNFTLPSHLNSNDTAGLSEFYIQIVDYVLDPTTHERTDSYTVLENITFNADGTVKSHTVNGSACGTTCTHVTKDSNGKITKINGTYFDFEETSEGQFMHCEVDKLTSNETVLQYFVYLMGSENDSIPAGTYYTNEYATITYTNYKGVEVQNEFPVPQMTWNGAQVRYTFYLVNENGQPVNRQGKVVPFAEAVYVTDIFVDSMTWNNLEQYESFDALLKASELLPDVYELYDQGARYDIHVFENEYGSNLNNHFVISSGFTSFQTTNGVVYADRDGDGKYDELAYTTYVFNNKSDTTKYSVPGYYALEENFWCFGTGTVTVGTDGNPSGYTPADGEVQAIIEYTGKLTGFTDEEWAALSTDQQNAVILINGANHKISGENGYYLYYKNDDGSWYTIVTKTSDYQVETGFDFANTAVAFAVVWTPGLKEDTVIVDFGLDVNIDVIANDIMIPGVVGISATQGDKTLYDLSYKSSAWETEDGNASIELKTADGIVVGTASIKAGDNAHIRVSFNKENGMLLNQPVSFYYEAKVVYYNTNNELVTEYMYSKVTIIPASTLYFEDSFVTLTTETKGSSGWSKDKTSTWTSEGTAIGGTQATDRPGADKIGEGYDADNNYGYDGVYASMSQYSMGSAAKVNVYSGHRARVTFEFYGTGFDVISLTSDKTGKITVNVYPYSSAGKYDSETLMHSYAVDTYYGYTRNDAGEWVVATDASDILYQVPVMKIDGLTYDRYHVEIVVAYGTIFDHNTAHAGYDFYLDAIRIYDPCGKSNVTVNGTDVYVQDGEGWPTYQELRNMILKAGQFSSVDAKGYYKETLTVAQSGYYTYNSETGEYAAADTLKDGVDYYTLATDGTYTKQIDSQITYYTGDATSGYTVVNVSEFEAGSTYCTIDEHYIVSGVVFIDGGVASAPSISDYTNYGPNNELYLAYGQAIATTLTAPSRNGYKTKVQLGIKTVGGTGSVEVYGIKSDGTIVTCVSQSIKTATDMYYDITALDGLTLVIKNSGESTDAIVALTNIKFSYELISTASATGAIAYAPLKADLSITKALTTMRTSTDASEEVEATGYLLSVSADTVAAALASLNAEEKTEEEVVPEETIPEETVPEETVPEETIPEETVPEETVPEETIPEETEPVVFEPEIFQVIVGKKQVKVGENVCIMIVTSRDVDSVSVNGKTVTNCITDRRSGMKLWIANIRAERAGEMVVEVVACNEEAVESEAFCETIIVTERRNHHGHGNKGEGRN